MKFQVSALIKVYRASTIVTAKSVEDAHLAAKNLTQARNWTIETDSEVEVIDTYCSLLVGEAPKFEPVIYQWERDNVENPDYATITTMQIWTDGTHKDAGYLQNDIDFDYVKDNHLMIYCYEEYVFYFQLSTGKYIVPVNGKDETFKLIEDVTEFINQAIMEAEN